MGLELVVSVGKLLAWAAIAAAALIVMSLIAAMGVLFYAAVAGAWSAREMDNARTGQTSHHRAKDSSEKCDDGKPSP